MNDDEARTLNYQLCTMAETHRDILGRMLIEWQDFKDNRLNEILQDYYKQ